MPPDPFPVEDAAKSVAMMLRSIARRDNAGFQYWRLAMNASYDARRMLMPILYEVFRLAVVRIFEGSDIKEIADFVYSPRPEITPGIPFQPAQAEALIRSALGETGLVGGISTQDVTVARAQVFAYLVEDMSLSESELDQLIADAVEWVLANEWQKWGFRAPSG